MTAYPETVSVDVIVERMPEETSEPTRKPATLNFSAVSWQDVIKLLGVLVLAAAAWTRIEARIDSVDARLTRTESSLSTYMPRELQEAKQQLILEKLDELSDKVNTLGRRLEKP